jgi:hypothetical protein
MSSDAAAAERNFERARAPRAAAVAGIIFSVLLAVVFVLVRLAMAGSPASAGEWASDETKRNSVVIALNIVPFAGIAFLWFIGVVRDRIGDAEDRFFATVFLGSGLLFVAMLFVGAASGSGLLLSDTQALPSGAWPYGRELTFALLSVYSIRMGAVFTICTTSLFTRFDLAPRWLIVLGYATGLGLLISSGFVPWLEIIFPAWVFIVSVHILGASSRAPESSDPAGADW